MATEEIWVGENDTRRLLEGDELAAFLAMRAEIVKQKADEAAAEKAKEKAKESAIAKLAALGLTPGEANAIVGN
jgi:hypothetical protein